MSRVFRPDIEGLRALAVLGVLVFHLSPGALPGGFVGVDVFFVISGYLICGSIAEELSGERFSFRDFYGRRLRRLLPAYFVMILGVYAAGLILLMPSELAFLGEAAAASALYVSNIAFMLRDSYFDANLKSSPLLHTWSLSVEEQFYLVLPVVMVLLYRVARAWVGIALFVIAAASLVYAELLLRHDAPTAFFWTPARLWQFLVGGGLAMARIAGPGGRWADVLMATGLAMVLACYAFFSDETRFPGLAAAAPTVGAALILHAGSSGGGVLSRLLLCNPLAAFFGRISYSLYLWHWPVIVFSLLHFGPLGLPGRAAAGAASIVLGYLSWRFVEQPTRTFPLSRPGALFGFSAAGMAAVAAVGAWFVLANGLPGRFSPETVRIASYLDYDPRAEGPLARCFLRTPDDGDVSFFDEKACVPADDGRFRIALIGDSHANHYAAAMREVWADASVAQVTASGCRPLRRAEGHPTCVALMKEALERIAPLGGFDLVVLSARWRAPELDELVETVRSLQRTVGAVVVFGPVVEYRASLPRLLAMDRLNPHVDDPSAWIRLDERRALDRLMAATLASTGARYISIIDAMCGERACDTLAQDGSPMQWDYGHFTRAGAADILRRIDSPERMAALHP